MQEKAKVVGIENDIVSVIPLDIEACIGCGNDSCKQNGNLFTALNRRKLDIRVGSEVRIAAPVKNQLSQAFMSVGVPVLVAVAVWILLPVMFSGSTEAVQVGGALLGFAGAAVLMFRITGKDAGDLPEITAVL